MLIDKYSKIVVAQVWLEQIPNHRRAQSLKGILEPLITEMTPNVSLLDTWREKTPYFPLGHKKEKSLSTHDALAHGWSYLPPGVEKILALKPEEHVILPWSMP